MMDNQHQKIKGYRELNQDEIDLMNEIKEHGEVTKKLIQKVVDLRSEQQDTVLDATTEPENSELVLNQVEESIRCINVASEALQTGQMWFVRAIALPDSF
jgi:hypothetical protein